MKERVREGSERGREIIKQLIRERGRYRSYKDRRERQKVKMLADLANADSFKSSTTYIVATHFIQRLLLIETMGSCGST